MLQRVLANGTSAEGMRYLPKVTPEFYDFYFILLGYGALVNDECMRVDPPEGSTPIQANNPTARQKNETSCIGFFLNWKHLAVSNLPQRRNGSLPH